MLDLSTANKKNMQVKISVIVTKTWFKKVQIKDVILSILPPRKDLVTELTKVDNEFYNDIDKAYSLVHKILQNNREKINIQLKTIEQMSLHEIIELTTGYIDFINELQSDPN